jgi:hypothetical protein
MLKVTNIIKFSEKLRTEGKPYRIVLQVFFGLEVIRNTFFRTEKWKGYNVLKERYPALMPEESINGKTSLLMYRQITMLKGWLKAAHQQCIHLQKDFDEFCYQFNGPKHLVNLFQGLIEKMVFHQLLFHKNY